MPGHGLRVPGIALTLSLPLPVHPLPLHAVARDPDPGEESFAAEATDRVLHT